MLGACGGKAAGSGSAEGAAGARADRELTAILRDIPAICRQGLDVSCATTESFDSCTHNAQALVSDAGAACLESVRAAVDCFAETGADCVDGSAVTPEKCVDAIDGANACILAKTDWTRLGCGAFHEPNDDGGVDSCMVTCGALSATCTSEGKGLNCICGAGPSKGRIFTAKDCPLAPTLAAMCEHRDLLGPP